MASIKRTSSGRYCAQVRLKEMKPTSKTFDTREQAEKWASKMELGFRKPSPTPQPNKIQDDRFLSFYDLGDQYCKTWLKGRPSQIDTIKRLGRIAPHLPNNALTISKYDINNFRLMRLSQVAPVTCRDDLQLIHRIYRWAHREMILDPKVTPSPCDDITMPPASKPRNKVVSAEELELLLSHLSPTMRTITELAYETAMRRSEIVRLTHRKLNLKERTAAVVDGKTGDRLVPLTKRAVELLRESLNGVTDLDAPLFPVTSHAVSVAVKRARRAAGLSEDIRLHQLRHTRITNVAKKGLNQAQIMMVSGHRDVRSVQRYTHLNVKDVIGLLD